jgi:hypothetical protein
MRIWTLISHAYDWSIPDCIVAEGVPGGEYLLFLALRHVYTWDLFLNLHLHDFTFEALFETDIQIQSCNEDASAKLF